MWLKQSTAATVKVGPFLDSVDGNTEETAMTISQADIRLSKNGGAFAQTNNAAGATHDEKGMYGVPLDTTDTGTLGTLRVHIHESGALPVWQDFMILPANVWDSLFGADLLQVDVTQLLGTAWAAPATAGLPDVNVKQISADAAAADNAESFFDGTGYAGTGNVIPTVTTLTNLPSIPANWLTAAGIAADAITAAKIADGAIDAATFAAGAINAAAIAADAITDAKVASDVTIASITGNVGGSVLGNVGGNVTGTIGSLAVQAKADVNTEVVDALATDTYAEPGQGAPAATATIAAKINYLFKAWRNKHTQTATEYALYGDDAVTKDQEAVVSDDGTTFSRGEVSTGA